MAERIQKVLANNGIGSRREVERWIRQGRVVVDDEPAQLGQQLTGTERIFLDGRPVRLIADGRRRHQYLAYYKPVGELTTRADPEGRLTVFDQLKPPQSGRWVAVGRLDINTSGLLLLTTDGELAHRLMHPSYELRREYAVRLLGRLTREQLGQLKSGVKLEDGLAKLDSIAQQGGSGANIWYHLTLHEGRNREIRRIFDAIGVAVSRLIRIGYGPIALGDLRRGGIRPLSPDEVDALYQAVDLRVPRATAL